ncbi:MAG: HAD family hydrolase [Bacteroidota bacterium]
MNTIRCVIFDMDGTLTQTNQLIFDSFNHIAQNYAGRTFSEKEITALFGPPEEGALVSIVGKGKIDAALRDYLDFYRKNHARLAKLYPGIVDILRFLKDKGCKLALFTGKGVHTTTITLDAFGLTPFFDSVVTGNDVINHKPSAEGIQKIMAHLAIEPAEALMIGDSVADVKAAHDAGVKMAAVLWDSYGKEQVLQMETDFLFHRVDEFSRWLQYQFQ